ncbi:MAG: hypothetical protein QXV17_14100, partial [Candidatus Micrarchaeaceae archaeon]
LNYKQLFTYKWGLIKFTDLFEYPYDLSGYKNNLTMVNNVSSDYTLNQSGLSYNTTTGDWFIGAYISPYYPFNLFLNTIPYMIHANSVVYNTVN